MWIPTSGSRATPLVSLCLRRYDSKSTPPHYFPIGDDSKGSCYAIPSNFHELDRFLDPFDFESASRISADGAEVRPIETGRGPPAPTRTDVARGRPGPRD